MRKMAAAVVGTSVLGLAFVWAGGPAMAHVEPSPIAVQKGTTAEITFNLEHGCGESPTTKVAIKVPDGVTGAKPAEKAGWTGTTEGSVVTFTGGPQPPHEETEFKVTFTFPATTGELHFPTVQTCEKGENAWIEIPVEGSPEPEMVAPTIRVTDAVPTGAELTPATEGNATETTLAAMTASSTETTTAAAATETTAAATETTAAAATETTVAAAPDTTVADSSSSGNGGKVVGVVVVLAVIAGAAVVVLQKRRN